MSDALAVVVVAYNSAGELPGLVASLDAELEPRDELIIVDNASSDGSAAAARALDSLARIVERSTNGGFGAGCRAGVTASSAPLILLLNPDARIEPGALALLRAVADERPEWAAWQPAVMLPDGRINSSGGVAHYLGISWAGQCGLPASELPGAPYETAFASGAALVLRRSAWQRLDGFEDSYFLYGEDHDLGLRLWLAGEHVGVEPRARVVHDYEFDKGAGKWFLLERNRWRTLLAVYPADLLAVLAPALLAAELGLIAVAARERWLIAKLRADGAALIDLPAALRRRHTVQATRTITSRAFARRLTASLDSPYLATLPRALVRAQAAYWSIARRLLR